MRKDSLKKRFTVKIKDFSKNESFLVRSFTFDNEESFLQNRVSKVPSYWILRGEKIEIE